MRAQRGFTLLEFMVASAMALVIITGATSLLLAVTRTARKEREDLELLSRLSLARSYLTPLLANVGYGWSATNLNAAGSSTGSFGQGFCVPASNVCSSGSSILPLTLTNSTTAPDELQVIVPRSAVVESLALTTVSTTTSGVTVLPVASGPTGTLTEAWGADDLVALSSTTTSPIGALSAGFTLLTTVGVAVPAGTYTTSSVAPAKFPVVCDTVTNDGLTDPCSHLSEVFFAYRVAVVRVRVKDGTLQTFRATTATEMAGVATDTNWKTVLTHVDDLQVQLEFLRVPLSGAATLCSANGSDVLDGRLFSSSAQTTSCSTTEALRGAIGDSTVPALRFMDVKLGLTLHNGLPLEHSTTVSGLFDRANYTDSLGRLHRSTFFYVGMPNAQH